MRFSSDRGKQLTNYAIDSEITVWYVGLVRFICTLGIGGDLLVTYPGRMGWRGRAYRGSEIASAENTTQCRWPGISHLQ